MKKNDSKLTNLRKPHYYGVMDGVHIFHGTHEDHKEHVGKHIEHPTEEDLKSAIKEAKEKKLGMIYVHGAPPQSLRSEIHPLQGPHVPGKLNKIEIAESWGEDEELEKMASEAAKANRIDMNPKEHHGRPVKVHWNLARDCWTVKCAKTNKLIGHTENIALKNPEYVVEEPKRQDVLASKVKGVHAHVHGAIDGEHTDFDETSNNQEKTPVSYNPFKGGSFFQRKDDKPVHTSDHAVMSCVNGVNKKGKAALVPRVFAKNPTDMKGPKGLSQEATDARTFSNRQAKGKVMKKSLSKGVAKPDQERHNPEVHMKALHDFIKEHTKMAQENVDHDALFAPEMPSKLPRPSNVRTKAKKVVGMKKTIKELAMEALNKIEAETVTLTTKDLAKGLINPEKDCQDCGCTVEACMCFNGLPEPKFTFDGKKLTILFKAEWDEASKEAYIDDFKRRAGRLINK